jgi:hypothetical protein
MMSIRGLLDQTYSALPANSDECFETSEGGAVFGREGLEIFVQLVRKDARHGIDFDPKDVDI